MSEAGTPESARLDADQLAGLAADIKRWGMQLGFQQLGVCDIELDTHEAALERWLAEGKPGNPGGNLYCLFNQRQASKGWGLGGEKPREDSNQDKQRQSAF